jgi:hypothetical protein
MMARFASSISDHECFSGEAPSAVRIVVLLVLLVALAVGIAQGQGTLSGPTYPAPNGSSVSFSGMIGGAGGMDVQYTNFDFNGLVSLYWGPWDGNAVEVAFDGSVDAAGEILSYDAGSSNLPAGVARWQGTADLTYWNVSDWTTVTVPTRFTVTATVGATPIALVDGASLGEGASGALLQVTGAFDLNLLAEAYYASTWTPVVVLFDSLQTPPGHQVITNLYDGFFYEVGPFFQDGFETGDCGNWSSAVGEVP